MSAGDLGSARGQIEIAVDGAMRNVSQLQGALNTFGSSAAKSFGQARDAGVLLGGIGVAILGGLGAAVNTAANFEQQMSAVNAVLDGTDAQMEAVRQTALRLGKDTSFSASESAAAIEELGKAGIGIDDILNGAAQGAVNLAAAAGVAVPQAATIMANALNIFSLGGEQATHVADVFAAGANKSAASVEDLAAGLSQSGAVASAFGISLEQSVGALALFADNGLKGSDAGTSLKTTLISMLDPTTKQAEKMTELGLAFFDTEENFIGLDGVAGQLQDKLKGLTEEERNTALAVLFGSDAVRAANILYKEGAAGVAEYTAAVNDVGAAQRAADIRLDNFKGSIDQLKGSLETLAIVIGSIFLPPLRSVVDVMTAVVGAIIDLPGPLQTVAAIFAGLAGAASLLAGGFILLAPRILATAQAFKVLLPLIAGVAAPIAAVVAVLALLGLAYKLNLGGFADFVNGVAGQVAGAFGQIKDAVGPVISVLRTFAGTSIFGGFGADAKAIQGTVAELTRIFGLNFDQARQVKNALTDMAKPIRQLRNSFRDVTQTTKGFFNAITGRASRKGLTDFHKRLDRLFGKEIGERAALATRDLARALKGLGASFKDATGFDLGKFLTLPAILETASRAVQGLAGFVRRDLIPALGPIFTGLVNGAAAAVNFLTDHMDDITSAISRVAGAIGTDFVGAFDVLRAVLSGDFSGAFDALIGLFTTIGGQLWTVLTTAIQLAAQAAIPIGNVIIDGLLILGSAILGGASSLWGWFKKAIGVGREFVDKGDGTELREPLSVGDVIVDGVFRLGANLLKWAGNIWGFAKDAIGASSGGFAGVGAGSPLVPPISVGDVIVDGILKIGETIGRWAGNLWGFVEDKLGAGGNGFSGVGAGSPMVEPISVGTVIIDGILALGDTLARWAGNLWGFVEDKLGANQSGFTGVGAGSPMVEPLSVGDVIVDGILRLGETLSTWAGNIWGWVEDQLGAGSQAGGLANIPIVGGVAAGQSISVGDILIDGALKLATDALAWGSGVAADIQAWIDGNKPGSFITVIDLTGFEVAFAEGAAENWKAAVKALLTADPIDVTPEIELNIQESVENWVRGIEIDWGDLKTLGIAAGLATAFFFGWPVAIGAYFTTKVGPDIARALRGAFKGVMSALFTDETTSEAVGPFGEFVGTTTSGLVSGLSDQLLGWFQKMADAIAEIDFTDILAPLFPDWMSTDAWLKPVRDTMGFIEGIIKGENPLKKLEDFLIQGASASEGGELSFSSLDQIGTSFANLSNNILTAQTDLSNAVDQIEATFARLFESTKSPAGNDLGGSVVERFQQSFANLKLTIPAPDTSAFDTAMIDVGKTLDTFEKGTFTADLLLDIGDVAIKYTDAYALGTVWAESVFTGEFLVDIQDVKDDANFAYSIGNQWANEVFTAKFAIDTSGLQGALDEAGRVAQAIRDIMPSSPAKKGPLSKPISFAYIADDLIHNLGRMVPAARSSLSMIAQQLGSLSSPALAAQLRAVPARMGGAGAAYVDNRQFFALKTDEYARLLREAQRGDAAHTWIAASSRALSTAG